MDNNNLQDVSQVAKKTNGYVYSIFSFAVF